MEWKELEVPCAMCEPRRIELIRDGYEVQDECPGVPERPGFCYVRYRIGSPA